MTQTTDPRLGTTVGGYRIESMIGRGGMSVVYLAEDTHLGRRVALKFLPPELASDAKFRERFVRESRLAASLEHPNIVTVYEAREADGQLYLAMRYVAGTDLKRLIAAEGPLDPSRAVSILAQAASALDAAHAEGLIHRDVKPGNILIAPRSAPGGRDRVYLSDFGLTKRATSDSGITATGQFVGTLDYAAPEQFEGRALDARADVYSLGCVAYECLTGEVPFPKENQAALVYAHLHAPPPKVTARRPELPGAIDAVVATAMAKRADDRYQSAGELASAVAAALGVEAVSAITPSTPTRPVPARPGRRPPRLALLAGAVIVVAVVLVGLILANRGGGNLATPSAPGTSASIGPIARADIDYLARIDPATGKVGAKIAMGEHPIDVAVGEGSVWVLDKDGSVRRIDPVTNEATVIQDVAQDPRAIAAGEGGIWIANGTNGVVRIDPATNQVSGSVRPGGTPHDVAVGTEALWVALRGSDGRDHLSRIDQSSLEVQEIAGEFLPDPFAQIVLALDGGFVWEASPGALYRYVIPDDRLDVFHLGMTPRGMAAYRGDVWITACGTPGTLTKVAADSGDVSATIPAGGAVCTLDAYRSPVPVAAGPEGVWITDSVNGTVSAIRELDNQVEAPIRIGDEPTGVAVGLGSVWVAVDGEVSPSPSTS